MLLVASSGAFLAFLDVTVVNVAFPSIRNSFPGTSLSDLSWVLNAYNIVFAAFLIVCGRLADLLGRRRNFIAGVAIFTVASGLCAAAPSVGLLVSARVVQAFGAAMLVPASLALVIEAFPAEHRTHAVGLWGASAALAAGLGPPIGGALVNAGGWRWAFLVNVPFGVAAMVGARLWLVESRSPGRRRLPDLAGAALLAGTLALLTLAIIKGEAWGWTSGRFLGVIAGSAVLFGGFVASSGRHRSPLLDPALLRIRPFAVANLATVVAGMGFYAYLLTNILWLQYVWRYSVLRAGLALVPGALVAAVVAAVMGPIAARRGYRPVVVIGAIVWSLAYVWYHQRAGVTPNFLSAWLPGQVLSGIGAGMTLPLLGSAALAAVPGGRYATASAVVSSARQLGGVLGIAILVVIVGSPTPATIVTAFRSGWVFTICCFTACALIASLLSEPRPSTEDDPEVAAAPYGSISLPSARATAEATPTADSLFASLPKPVQDHLTSAAERVHVPAGGWLMQVGEPADALYVLVAGRLEVVAGKSVVRELSAGAVIGELALLTGGVRSASVRARRDSVALKVSRQLFDETIRSNPAGLDAVVTTLAGQLSGALPTPLSTSSRPHVVSVVAVHAGAPVAQVAAALTEQLAGSLRIAAVQRVSVQGLERAERDHDCVLLSTDGQDAEWAAFCVRQADLVVLVAASDSPPVQVDGVWQPDLVLVGRPAPAASLAKWSDLIGPWQITQVAADDLADRLRAIAARISGRSLGVVLAGGGARALGHVGVLRELEDAGLHVDRIAGCSIGAIIGALYATGMDGEELEAVLYEEFVRGKPFSDYTLPRASLARGNRAMAAFRRYLGENTLIEALPRQFRCVSTDLLSRSAVMHRNGNLVDAVSASSRLPVLFAPLSQPGRLLVDGAILNNLPVELLTERDEGPVIAVNVSLGGGGSTAADPQRPPRVPALGETLLRTMTIGSTRAEHEAHERGAYVVTPPSMGVGLLEFHQLDRMAAAGRAAARHLLAQTGDKFAG